MDVELGQRIDTLEALFGEFVAKVGAALIRMERDTENLKREMAKFKDEMAEFKNEMAEFKDEVREENRQMNRRWGEITNRLGIMTESLVAPSMQRIIREQFNREILDVSPNRKRKVNGREKEFDVIAVSDDLVFLTSVKTTLRNKYINDFVDEIKEFREFFPEYRDKKVVGIMAALNIDENQLKYAEKKGFLVLGVEDQIMEVKNRKGFKPKLW